MVAIPSANVSVFEPFLVPRSAFAVEYADTMNTVISDEPCLRWRLPERALTPFEASRLASTANQPASTVLRILLQRKNHSETEPVSAAKQSSSPSTCSSLPRECRSMPTNNAPSPLFGNDDVDVDDDSDVATHSLWPPPSSSASSRTPALRVGLSSAILDDARRRALAPLSEEAVGSWRRQPLRRLPLRCRNVVDAPASAEGSPTPVQTQPCARPCLVAVPVEMPLFQRSIATPMLQAMAKCTASGLASSEQGTSRAFVRPCSATLLLERTSTWASSLPTFGRSVQAAKELRRRATAAAASECGSAEVGTFRGVLVRPASAPLRRPPPTSGVTFLTSCR